MRHLFLGLMLLIGCAASLSAATYFVDYSAGSNANAGTSQTAPWKHCPGDPAASGVPASRALAAGDTVIFKGGVTYVFTGATGIVLKWSGAAGNVITYDGNSSGTWGTGRARFTDNHSSRSITAFSAAELRRHLVFKNLEFSAIGGAATLPVDTGTPAPAKFGGGIAFTAGVESLTIDRCVFSQLGYWFNQRPMNAASVAGAAILMSTAQTVTISNCEFSRVAIGCEVVSSTGLLGVEVKNCTFGEAIVWPVNLPSGVGSVLSNLFSVVSNTYATDNTFESGWTGYDYSPRVSAHSVAVGASVTFVASATASPAATFQWRKNGVPIPGATNVNLNLASVTTLDAGTYTALATNSAGSTLSNAAVLLVNGALAPIIQTPLPPVGGVLNSTLAVVGLEPQVQQAPAGSTVTLLGAATGSPQPTYQWRKNGTPIPGATSASLVLSNVTTADSGTYTFAAINAGGTAVSAQTLLQVQAPVLSVTAPAITLHPTSAVVVAGNSVTFRAGASGTMPRYEWKKNGVTISGATSETLTLANVSAAQAGNYTFIATNSAGTATSRAATLTVNTLPVIASHPQSQVGFVGGVVEFKVIASGVPAPSYQWRKNGAPLAGATTATLRLRYLTANDEAAYTVEVRNTAGTVVSHPATLTVNTPPVIAQQPQSRSVEVGGAVTFTVGATGRPDPTYQWFRNGSPISGATGATLMLAPVAPNLAGAYTVLVRNAGGSITSSVAQLAVEVPSSGTFRVGGLMIAKEFYVSKRLIAGGDWLEATFANDGMSQQKILVRAVGPGMTAFGIEDVLADPQIEIFSGTNKIQSNDNWGGGSSLSGVFTQVGAFPLAEPASKDAAFVVTLPRGTFRVKVSSVDGSSGGYVLLQMFVVP